MTNVAETETISASEQKQRIYRRYANGEIPWEDMSKEISSVKPDAEVSVRRYVAYLALTFLVGLIVPPWAKRNN